MQNERPELTPHLTARFSQSRFDMVCLRLTLSGTVQSLNRCDDVFLGGARGTRLRTSVYMTSFWCPFTAFIHFLEAITTGVQECAFEWDPEGPWGRMAWENHAWKPHGWLTVSWRGGWGEHRREFSHRAYLDTRQAVGMLYTAFRRFVESPAYNPYRYERMKAGEAFGLAMEHGDVDALAETLVEMDTRDAVRLIVCIVDMLERPSSGAVIQRPVSFYVQAARSLEYDESHHATWMSPEWDNWDTQTRMLDVKKDIYSMDMGWEGANLRRLRSPMIERWLAGGRNAPEQG